MNRTAWNAQRQAHRSASPRALRGLPHHPNGTGYADCAECNGTGAIDVPHWNPECETSYTCSACAGRGTIADGHRDPLLRLRHARQPWVRRKDPTNYSHLRFICATPAWRLRLIEAAVGCEIATRRAVKAWRAMA